MPHEELRPYGLQDWHALDESTATRIGRARNALALVQDLAVEQKRTTTSTVELNKDELGDFLSLIIDELDTSRAESQPMREFLKSQSVRVLEEVAQ